MKFNRCVRCGCFFNTEGNVCPTCAAKDEVDKVALKNFITTNEIPENVETLSFYSGVELKNINRFLQMPEFDSVKSEFDNLNKKIEL